MPAEDPRRRPSRTPARSLAAHRNPAITVLDTTPLPRPPPRGPRREAGHPPVGRHPTAGRGTGRAVAALAAPPPAPPRGRRQPAVTPSRDGRCRRCHGGGSPRPRQALLGGARPSSAGMVTTAPGERGEVLLRQGEFGGDVILVGSGLVTVGGASPLGDESLLALRGAGEVLGEVALLDGGPCSATATALTPARGVTVAAGDFRRLPARQPTGPPADVGIETPADRGRPVTRVRPAAGRTGRPPRRRLDRLPAAWARPRRRHARPGGLRPRGCRPRQPGGCWPRRGTVGGLGRTRLPRAERRAADRVPVRAGGPHRPASPGGLAARSRLADRASGVLSPNSAAAGVFRHPLATEGPQWLVGQGELALEELAAR